MDELFSSGRIVEAILLLMSIECVVLIVMRRRSGSGLPIAASVTNLAAGASLLLSLRAALLGSPWQIISLWLLVALLAHVADLKMRWGA